MLSRKMAHIGPLLLAIFLSPGMAVAQSSSPLRLEKTIPTPDVDGRIDHFAFDSENQRLFVAALGNNTVRVIDIKIGKVTHTISGLAEPQGVVYEPQEKRLWIANGNDGTVRIFDAQIFKLVRSIELGDDADNVRLDKVADVKLDAHPESFQLEKNGSRIFVNLPGSKKIAVIDRAHSAVAATWQTDDATSNFPMALDEADGRLFIVCRKPALFLVLDMKSGAVVAKLPAVGDSDDVFYDQRRKRIYASGGEGAISVYQQQDPNHYSKTAQIETVKGARTSLFVPELDRLFLAVRRQGENPAAIQVYEVMP
jgi:YVTN family beta-propeller protein